MPGGVAAWSAFIVLGNLAGSIWIAAALFALAGAADSVSAVCRSTMPQTPTPDSMRGRMSSVCQSRRCRRPPAGDVESGSVAALTSTTFSVVSGGLAAVFLPRLDAYDGEAIGTGAAREEQL